MAAMNRTAQVQEVFTRRLPLLWFSLAFLGGAVLASVLGMPVYVWLMWAGAAVVLALLAGRLLPPSPIPFVLIAVCLAGWFLGAARYQSVRPPELTANDAAFYNDRLYDVLLTGWVSEMPDRRDRYTNLRIQAEAIDTGSGDLPIRGLVLARVGENESYQYGDRVRLRGRLLTPPADEDFSYRDYLARQGVLSYMPITEATLLPGREGSAFWQRTYAFKERLLGLIYRLFPDPEASLMAGILLGVDTGLTRGLQNAFKDTGTAHIIAISGFNISIIAGLFVMLFSRWLGPRRGSLLALLAIFFYTLLVGAGPSVVRAAIMGGLSLFARQVGRRNMALNTLAVTALIMAAFNPLLLWDVGFQLSFFATLGLILYSEPLSNLADRLLRRMRVPDPTVRQVLPPLSNFVLLTLAAQIATLPIMAYHFKRISLVSLLANPFVLPAQPAVMILGGLALFLGLVLFPLGQAAAWLAWPFVDYTIRAVELFDRIPRGTLYLGDTSLWLVAGFYMVLLGVTLNWDRIRAWFASLGERTREVALIGVLTVLFAGTLLGWRSADSLPDGKLHLTFFSVGSADAVLVQTPSGRSVLVNGGPCASEISDDLGRRLPVFDRRLDWLVVASTAENEVASLPRVLERYPPRGVLWSGNVEASFSSRQLISDIAEGTAPIFYAEQGQKLDLGDDATIEVLGVGPRGSVLLVRWRDFRALLPVGLSADMVQEMEYGNTIGPVQVLLLADSGFSGTNTIDWIDNLHPQLLVLSVAAGDPDGLPSSETLDAAAGYPMLRTDQNGWIEVSTDGVDMQVKAERQQ